MDIHKRKSIEKRAEELGHTVTESYGTLEVCDSNGTRVAVFERQRPTLKMLDTGEDVLSALPGITVISCS